MYYWVDSPQASGPLDRAAFGRRKLEMPQAEFDVTVPVNGEGGDILAISLDYLYCRHGDDGVCKAGSVVFTVPVNVSAAGVDKRMQLVHTIEE